MSGSVVASNTPWMRSALATYRFHHADELAEIEAALPDGVTVGIYCIASPTPLGAHVNGLGEPIRIEAIHYSVGAVLWAAVRLAETRVAA